MRLCREERKGHDNIKRLNFLAGAAGTALAIATFEAPVPASAARTVHVARSVTYVSADKVLEIARQYGWSHGINEVDTEIYVPAAWNTYWSGAHHSNDNGRGQRLYDHGRNEQGQTRVIAHVAATNEKSVHNYMRRILHAELTHYNVNVDDYLADVPVNGAGKSTGLLTFVSTNGGFAVTANVKQHLHALTAAKHLAGKLVGFA